MGHPVLSNHLSHFVGCFKCISSTYLLLLLLLFVVIVDVHVFPLFILISLFLLLFLFGGGGVVDLVDHELQLGLEILHVLAHGGRVGRRIGGRSRLWSPELALKTVSDTVTQDCISGTIHKERTH